MTTINWSAPTPLTIEGSSGHIQSQYPPSATGLDQNILIAYAGSDAKLYSTQFNTLDQTCSAPAAVPKCTAAVAGELSLGIKGAFINGRNCVAVGYSDNSNHHPTLQFFDIAGETWSAPMDLTTLNPGPAPLMAFHPALTVCGEELRVIAPGTSGAPRSVYDCPYDLMQDRMETRITTNISQQIFRGYGCETLDDTKILLVIAGVNQGPDGIGDHYFYSIYDSAARTWSAVKPISTNQNLYSTYVSPGLQSIGNGKAVLLYTSNFGLYLQYSIYDSTTDTWSDVQALPHKTSGAAPTLVAAGNKLYAFFPVDPHQHIYNVMSAPFPS